MTESTAAVQVGENVRLELARARKSQSWLAGVLQISQQSVSSRLRGEVAFNVDELTHLAAALDVSVASLLAEPRQSAAS
jgi:transcriptional regulator with XRE-family HTH domain